MTYTIAVAGKGGVGKTTFCAMAIRHLNRKTGKVVLAVDADSNHNLGAKLGQGPGRTLGDIREELASYGEEPPPSMSKQEYIDYQVRLALREGDGFDLLTMGRPEGPGCYCFINNMLRNLIDSISERYDHVVIDNEAGMEHLSRRTTRSTEVLFVLCDTTRSSLSAANRIADLAEEMALNISRTVLVVDQLGQGQDLSSYSSDRFDAVYSVRGSAWLCAHAKDTESLMDMPASDPAFSDVGRAVESERVGR
ncbi:MAG: AAA family ATPase [Candidatus Thermoplasmatota archaeon]|nr:AAA family ATPase [Candidatus Thermoplasmatota archaeon]